MISIYWRLALALVLSTGWWLVRLGAAVISVIAETVIATHAYRSDSQALRVSAYLAVIVPAITLPLALVVPWGWALLGVALGSMLAWLLVVLVVAASRPRPGEEEGKTDGAVLGYSEWEIT